MKDERGVVSNVDTFAQWTQTDFNINIVLPESQEPIKITANPSSIGQGESCDVFLTYGSGDNTINVTGNLKQVVHTGNAMSEVVLRPNSYKRCFPIAWIKNEIRPSGIKMTGDSANGTSLGFSGTPTSDDTITIPQLINKFVVSLPTDLSTKHYNWDSTVQEADKYFLNSMRVTITADEGYKFPTNMEYSNVTITPTTMTQYLTMTRLSDTKLEFSLKGKSELDLTKLSDVQIDIPACERSSYSVEIAIGPHMTTSGGALIQNVVIGQPITQINLAVTDEMTFMPNIHNYSKDGITINVDTSTGTPYTKAWVSGTPLRDTQITVRDAVKGAKLNVVLPSDGSVLVKAGEEARLNQFIESGEYIDGVTLVPAENYHMDQEWRKSIQVVPANDYIMMMTTESETFISGTIVDDTVVTIPSGLEDPVNGGQYMLTVDTLGTNLFGVAGFRSKECRGPVTSHIDKNITFGSITPGNYFGKKIIGCYISGSDGLEDEVGLREVSPRITGTCYMVLELENKDHSGVSGSVMCGVTFSSIGVSGSLGQESQTTNDTLYFDYSDNNGGLFGDYQTLLAEKGRTIPVTITPMQRGGVVVHSDTFNELSFYEGRWWYEYQLSNVSAGAVVKYIRNILTETGPKNVVLYTDETSDNSYFTNIPYGLSERFAIQFNDTKKIPMIWSYSDSKKGYYANLDYDMFCIDIGEDAYNNMSKPCTVKYWSRPYWFTLSLPETAVVNGDPVKLTLTCYGVKNMFRPDDAEIGIDPSLISSLQVQIVTPLTSVSPDTYEAIIKFTGTRDYTFSYDIIYVTHLDEVATVGIQLSYSGSV